jgi:predicted DCC family thiol-disulfide oxidoreductase YuxK
MSEVEIKHPVVLFDGVCNYCNSMINFTIKWNKKKNLRYATLQSNIGKSLISRYNIDSSIDSVILIEQDKVYIYSSAALKIAMHLQFPMNLFVVFYIIPSFIRNPIYKWFAANRYRWFGKKESCMIPSKEIKQLFLE